jgi:hypothetical protein
MTLKFEVSSHSVVGCPGIRHCGSPDRRILVGTITRVCLAEDHHADMASLSGRVLTIVASNLGVVFG